MNLPLIRDIQNKVKTIGQTAFDLKSLHCYLKGFDYKRVTKEARQGLRRKLIGELKYHYSLIKSQKKDGISEELLKNLLKPGESLKNAIAAISISHCPILGGFIFSFDKGLSVGLDIELVYRLKDKLLSRISTKEEAREAPGPAFLWAAKEASFKCACSSGTALHFLNQCFISQWRQIEETSYRFHFQTKGFKNVTGEGFTFLTEELVLSVAILRDARSLLNRSSFSHAQGILS